MVGISSQVLAPISCDCSQNELNFATQNPAFSNLIMQLDPWISPYRFFIIIIIFITIQVKVMLYMHVHENSIILFITIQVKNMSVCACT